MKNKKTNLIKLITFGLLIVLYGSIELFNPKDSNTKIDYKQNKVESIEYKYDNVKETIVSYNGYDFYEYDTINPIIYFNNNVPLFSKEEIDTIESFEIYSDLDKLGRCGQAFAKLGIETMPTEPRGKIGMIKPSGWKTIKYDFVDGKYLFNRCHLIGFQLSGENANECNLITGTRYFNNELMLPFENEIDDYIEKTNNHVLYRVTPLYNNEELVARGIVMEAYSIEDKGKGIQFCVFLYNIQPNIEINYKNGDSWEIN